jgi:hypothetical protein
VSGIHGAGPDHVLAVGGLGTVLRYDGTAWRREPPPEAVPLIDVWVKSPTEAWIVGRDADRDPDGVVLQLRDGAWSSALVSPTYEWSLPTDVWGLRGGGEDGVWLVGNSPLASIWRRAAGAWATELVMDETGSVGVIWGLPDGPLYAGTAEAIWRWAGRWEADVADCPLRGVGAIGGRAEEDLWAGGQYGEVYHRTRDPWVAGWVGTVEQINGLTVLPSGDVFLVGNEGGILRGAAP